MNCVRYFFWEKVTLFAMFLWMKRAHLLPTPARLGLKPFLLSLRGAPATWQSRPTKFLRQRLGALDRRGLRPRDDAFSLVELSIVLVILGLLVGGVLSGQSLIRAAELRAVTSEHSRYMAAVQSFRDKYFALPGDMANATQFWGAAHATPATCQTTASTTIATCDGNGDGQVLDGSYEIFRFWQHLANAGLIEGQYNGVAGPAHALNHVIGTNAPRARMSNAGWGFSFLGNHAGDAGTYALDYGHLFWFGSPSIHRPQSNILKPEEAWNVDTKVDDGRPAMGKVIMRSETGGWGTASNCTTSTSNTDYNGNYNLASSTVGCALMIRQQ